MTRDTDERGKILPCAFCYSSEVQRNSDKWGHFFACECGARGPYADSPAGALLLWNTRTPAGHAELEADPSRDNLIASIQTTIAMISELVEEHHDFDYEPHQVPAELQAIKNIQHHLEGSLINSTGQFAALANAPAPSEGARISLPIVAALARRLCQLFDSGGESQRSVRARHASAIFQLLNLDEAAYATEQIKCDANPVAYLEQAERFDPHPSPADTEDQGPDTLGERP